MQKILLHCKAHKGNSIVTWNGEQLFIWNSHMLQKLKLKILFVTRGSPKTFFNIRKSRNALTRSKSLFTNFILPTTIIFWTKNNRVAKKFWNSSESIHHKNLFFVANPLTDPIQNSNTQTYYLCSVNLHRPNGIKCQQSSFKWEEKHWTDNLYDFNNCAFSVHLPKRW